MQTTTMMLRHANFKIATANGKHVMVYSDSNTDIK